MEITLDSQKINYNPEKKIAVTTIKTPFFSAGKQLGWKFHSQGIGLNLRVIQFLLASKFTLVVYIEHYNHTYFLKYEHLKNFLDNNNTDYKIHDTILKLIPIDILTSYKQHTIQSTPSL